ncbi:MAG TPA: NTP transferase domain-containing protein [Steroidobacteraceae bacterium]|jgi:molybdopterin-guanine dinucleotide biosynthesis protein A|nr:NTP transferase domain-containing protein [Steroidobacteraceae bacterium]
MSGKATPPVYGLVLAGGKSTRMQRDKATLSYRDGKTQLESAMQLVGSHAERTFVSVRPGQNDPVRARFEQIVDTREGLGPIAGIQAAQARYPDAAWLVVACDLPFIDNGTLEYLLAERDPARQATAFRSGHFGHPKHNGLPEPLCAIYEPASREPILAHIAGGKDCPRKFLINADTKLLDQPNPRALDNVNTPEEYGSAMASLNVTAPATRKRIKVQYYALLREQAGRSEEVLDTTARTPRELYEELKARHPFSLAPEMLRVAVNAEFGEWTHALADGDSVVFIPPVAGG